MANTMLLIFGAIIAGLGAYAYITKDKTCDEFTNEYECFIQGTLFMKGCSWDPTTKTCVGG